MLQQLYLVWSHGKPTLVKEMSLIFVSSHSLTDRPLFTLVHQYFFGCVLCGFLLLLALSVGRMCIQVHQEDGDERNGKVRQNHIKANLECHNLILQTYARVEKQHLLYYVDP